MQVAKPNDEVTAIGHPEGANRSLRQKIGQMSRVFQPDSAQ
jgi:hypothetical protein